MADPAKMAKIHDLLTADEIKDGLRFVEGLERGQHMDRDQAEEWRRRIVARKRFLEMSACTGTQSL